MQNEKKTTLTDYDRLKEINAELSVIASQRRACRSRSGLLGAVAGVILAVSLIAFFHNLLNRESDWHANTQSPVHQVATQDKTSTTAIALSVIGIFTGLGLFIAARVKCGQIGNLSAQERGLMGEMRILRDKMYVKGQQAADHRFRPKREEQTQPLGPDEVRSEYVGVYSPPGAKRGS